MTHAKQMLHMITPQPAACNTHTPQSGSMIQAVYTKFCYHQHVASKIKTCWMVECVSAAKVIRFW